MLHISLHANHERVPLLHATSYLSLWLILPPPNRAKQNVCSCRRSRCNRHRDTDCLRDHISAVRQSNRFRHRYIRHNATPRALRSYQIPPQLGCLESLRKWQDTLAITREHPARFGFVLEVTPLKHRQVHRF